MLLIHFSVAIQIRPLPPSCGALLLRTFPVMAASSSTGSDAPPAQRARLQTEDLVEVWHDDDGTSYVRMENDAPAAGHYEGGVFVIPPPVEVFEPADEAARVRVPTPPRTLHAPSTHPNAP